MAHDYSLSPIEHRWCNIVQLWAYVQDYCKLRTSTGGQQLPFRTYLWGYECFVNGTMLAYNVVKTVTTCLVLWTMFFVLLFSKGEWEAPELLKSQVWIVEFVLNLALFLAICFLPILSLFILFCFISFITRLFYGNAGPPVDRANLVLFNTTLTDARDAIIYEIATRKATNPKDKSFGLRAVLGRIGIPLDDPDYDKDIYQIYRELFVRLLDWSGSLNLLLFCDSSTMSTLPSWMPNLAIDPDKSWLNPKALAFQGGFEGVFFRTPSQWSLTDNKELIVRGVHVCCVSWSSGKFYETSIADYASDEQSHLHNIPMIHDLMRRYRKWKPTACANRHHVLLHWERKKLNGKDKRTLKEWGQMIRRTSIMPDASMSAFSYLKSHPACFEFHIDMCNDLARRERTLFLTQPGTLGIGNGPANVQVTDLVTLVAGVSKPLILEPRGTRHRLKGFADMEYEPELSALVIVAGGNISLDPYWSGWEDLSDEMQPRDEIVLY
ncbi:hypothetical protein CEP54_011495 [Fusarium duplospermum]|uniref:Uncharacterized protein n=1 Tax=Fusarium duplospermum TaxID=1325734 RepID=A0A428PE16_9HYPO|nr:hypothetical protein CEP54_011495 [Fusarium duplospermum]